MSHAGKIFFRIRPGGSASLAAVVSLWAAAFGGLAGPGCGEEGSSGGTGGPVPESDGGRDAGVGKPDTGGGGRADTSFLPADAGEDSTVPDATPEAGLPDTGRDAGPLPADLCGRCRRDSDCLPGLVCAPAEGRNRAGFCTAPCPGGRAAACPRGTVCEETEAGSLCIPLLGCDRDRCLGADPCGPGKGCDPTTGDCLPLDEFLCRPCWHDSLCGGDTNRCLTNPFTGESFCSLSCLEDYDCPEDFFCLPLGGGEGQCFPRSDTCNNPCEGKECAEGTICQPHSGDRCIPPDQALCAGPCISPHGCGREGDMCIAFQYQYAFCGRECSGCATDRDCPQGGPCDGNGRCPHPFQVCVEGQCRLQCLGGECYGCGSDADCPEGSVCDGLRCRSCPDGFFCVDVVSGGGRNRVSSQCAPITGECDTPFLGIPCGGEAGYTCGGRNTECSSEGEGGVCTRRCRFDSDCPEGWRRCEEQAGGRRLCVRQPPSGWAACGAAQHGREQGQVGASCAGGVPCAAGACVSVWFRQAQHSFCSRPCETDEECGPEALCTHFDGAPGGGKACMPIECSCLRKSPPGSRDLLREALQQSPCEYGYSPLDVAVMPEAIRTDRFRLASFNDEHRSPFLALRRTASRAARLDSLAGGPALLTGLLATAAAELDVPLPGEVLAAAGKPPEDPAAEPEDEARAALVEGVLALFDAADVPPEDEGAIRDQAARIPGPVAAAAARVLQAMDRAIRLRADAFAALGEAGDPTELTALVYALLPAVLLPNAEGRALNLEGQFVQDFLDDTFGHDLMVQAAAEVTMVLDTTDWTVLRGLQGFRFNVETPVGRVILADATSNRHTPRDPSYSGPIAFLLDTGGNDVYEIPVGGTSSPTNPVAIAVDLGGSDTYGYVPSGDASAGTRLPDDGGGRYDGAEAPPFSLSEIPRQGSGRLGVGILVDLGTEGDRYTSLRMSQGFGVLGVGLLYDAGGDDTYAAEAGAQGSALFGIGILHDGGGNDTYRAWQASQGFAFTRGFGLLHDAGSGEDSYLAVPAAADDPDLLYPSGEDNRINLSLSQGVGFGLGGTYGEARLYLAGGLGMLRDAGGNDTYRAGVLAQGAAVSGGRGLLSDGGGDDRYDAAALAQASAVSHSLAVLLEEGGNDRFNVDQDPVVSGHLASGSDYGVAVLFDLSGNDRYVGNVRAAGSAAFNAVALLVDVAGDDSYEMGDPFSLGAAEAVADEDESRRNMTTAAVFVDAGGTDRYFRPDLGEDGAPSIGDDRRWEQRRTGGDTLERAVGLDGSGHVVRP